MPIDHRSHEPVYVQIARELRERIRSGQYPRGGRLPSETDLTAEYDVTRLTVRRALSVLATEGLTESIRGKGVFVREIAPVLRLGSNRFSRAARAAGKGALAAEAESLGLTWSQEDLELARVQVSPEIADELGESSAVVKRRRMIVADHPTQLADSYVPATIADQIGYLTGATAPGGLYGLLEANGHQITRFRESITVRAATPEESVALDLPAGAPVAGLVRLAYSGDRVLEYFDSVAAGDKHIYVYDFDAPTG